MIPTLMAEFKKLLTVRSTYLLVLAALILTGLFTYFGTSPIVYEEVKESAAVKQAVSENRPPPPEEVITRVSHDLPKERLITHLQDSIPPTSMIIAIAVVLLMAHEFRYNTISYTLTAANRRSKVLISKIIVGIVFTAIATLLVIAVTVAAVYAAVLIKDLNLPAQDYNWGYILLRLFGYTVGFSLMALAVATLVRSAVAGVVAVFLLPAIDSIAAAILASRGIEGSKFLPFSALNRVKNVAIDYLPRNVADDSFADLGRLPATVIGAAAVFAIYFVTTWIISWYLFLRRDAT